MNPFPVTDGLPRSAAGFETVQRLILNGVFDAEKLISHVIKPDQIMEAYQGLMFEKETWHCVAIDWKAD